MPAHQEVHNCRSCNNKKNCGRHHVYVIELNPDEFSEKYMELFKNRNPQWKGKTPCFYVGETSHTVSCRYKQHKRKGKNIMCSCFGETKTRKVRQGRGWVRNYGLSLKAEYFFERNPIPEGTDPHCEETKLALELQSNNFGVWWNKSKFSLES